MNTQTFDYAAYLKMPLSARKTMLTMIQSLAPQEGNAAYMMVYEKDPDPELREMARQALEKNGVQINTAGVSSQPEYNVTAASLAEGIHNVKLDGSDGKVLTQSDLMAIPNIFALNRANQKFVAGKTKHISRSNVWGILGFVLAWTVFLGIAVVGTRSTHQNLGFFGVFFGGGGVVGVIWLISTIRHERKLERDGKLLLGQIVNASGRWVTHTSTSNGKTTTSRSFDVTVNYVFRTPEGERITAGATRTRGDLQDAIMPEPGLPVVIMYLSNTDYVLL